MRKVLCVLVLLAVMGTACSTAWVTTLDAIVSAAAPALINILEIVAVANGQPVNALQVSKINSDASAIKTLAGDFAAASGDAAANACSQLQAAIGVYQQDQQMVLSAAQVSDVNTQTKINLLSNLVAGTAEAILAVIPSCEAPGQATNAAFKSAPPLRLSSFVASYNSVLTEPTGNVAVDGITGKMKLHEHSKAVRILTLGRLQ